MLTRDEVHKIAELYETFTNDEIASRLGITRDGVNKWIKKLKAKGYITSTKKAGRKPTL